MEFKELLESKDMTASRLSRILGLSRSAVSAWVSGRTEPNLTTLVQISQTLDVGIEELVLTFVKKAG